VIVTTLWNSEQPLVQWAVPVMVVLIAAVTDLRARRIPNWLTLPTLALGVGFAAWTGGIYGIADSLLACVVLSLPYVLLFLFAGGGAGDAKLMGAVGAWLGVINGGVALASVAVCGIVLGIAYAVAARRTRELMSNISGIAIGWAGSALVGSAPQVQKGDQERAKSQTVPYGVAICAGVYIAAVGIYLWRA
jgi:prepilin peptidase CpaA